MSSDAIDIGHGHEIADLMFNPEDNENNRRVFGVPLPHLRIGIQVMHPHKATGHQCAAGIYFDTPEVRKVTGGSGAHWQVESWDPLTLSPSLLCLTCGDHGFIKAGRWVPA